MFQAKIICTQRKILVTCILIPIASLLSFSYLIVDIGAVPNQQTGYIECVPKEHNKHDSHAMAFKSKIQIWIILYFFIPAIVIVLLNAGIVTRLAQAHKFQRAATIGSKTSSSPTAVMLPETNKAKSTTANFARKLSRTFSRNPSQLSTSSSAIRQDFITSLCLLGEAIDRKL